MKRPLSSWVGRPLMLLLALVAAHLGLLLIEDLGSRIAPAIAIIAAASLTLWLGIGWLRRVPPTRAMVIGGAVLLRLVLLPLPPTLSDDALRYLWDGRVAGAGLNPYALAPEAPELSPLRDELWQELSHRNVATVYPPLAVGLFTISSRLPQPLLAVKAALSVADVAGCWLLLVIARRRKLPEARVLLYAWNPVVCLETAGMGHVDALGVAAVTAVVLLVLAPRRPLSAAVAAVAAVLAKVVPVLAWPAWARQSGKPGPFVIVGTALLAVAWIPVLISTGGVPPGYIRFGVSWEFNGPLYEPLWRALDALDATSAVESMLDTAKSWTGSHDFWNRAYPLNYPQLLAKGILLFASLPFFTRAWAERDPIRSTERVFSVLVIFSATVYPWYLLWVLPWAALRLNRAWLLLAALMPLSYLPQFLDLELFPAVFCAIWVPFFIALGLERRWSAN